MQSTTHWCSMSDNTSPQCLPIKKQIPNTRLAHHYNAIYHTLVQHERQHLIPMSTAAVLVLFGCTWSALVALVFPLKGLPVTAVYRVQGALPTWDLTYHNQNVSQYGLPCGSKPIPFDGLKTRSGMAELIPEPLIMKRAQGCCREAVIDRPTTQTNEILFARKP